MGARISVLVVAAFVLAACETGPTLVRTHASEDSVVYHYEPEKHTRQEVQAQASASCASHRRNAFLVLEFKPKDPDKRGASFMCVDR